MKKLGLYSLPFLTAATVFAEQIGNNFVLLDEVEKIVFAADYSRIARAKIAGSDSTEVKAKVDSLFEAALGYQRKTTVPLSWAFNVEGNKIGLVGKLEGPEFATADTLVALGDSVAVNPEAIPEQRTQSSPLSVTGFRAGASYGGVVSPEVGLVFGNRLVISGSPYSLPDSRDPEGKRTRTTPDPVFGTMYETTVDTARVAKTMRNLSLGVILPPVKNLELTLGGGIHWEENAVEGYAETQKIDRNGTPLIHGDARSGPFHSGKNSTGYTLNGGLGYKIGKNDVGLNYQRVLGKNGRNRTGIYYGRNF
ncbi:hypothetical protein HYT57_00140 [Candidatus Woesearchaeota archaeon]|nr:hypothetical protein [Candidatus Woesearchaeota archaeon]